MSLTKTVTTFALVVTLTVAFSSTSELQAQSGSRSVGGSLPSVGGSGTRSVIGSAPSIGGSGTRSVIGSAPSVVTDFGGAQQSYVAPQVEYSNAPIDSQYSSAPTVSSAPAYSPAVSSGCGCSAAPAPVASPCGGGCGGGCGNRNFGTLRRAPSLGASGRFFQRG